MTAPSDGDSCYQRLANRAVPHMSQSQLSAPIDNRSYGLHWCFNIVCDRGSAVLIRALEPTHGLETMMARRAVGEARKLCAGPGNLCKALAITGEMNGLSVLADPFSLEPPSEMLASASGVRIGISKAAERPWRFTVKGSRCLSRPI